MQTYVYLQTLGYLLIDDKKILVLVRQKKYTRCFKLRKSGADGSRFEEEEIYLSKNRQKLYRLLNGEVIEL